MPFWEVRDRRTAFRPTRAPACACTCIMREYSVHQKNFFFTEEITPPRGKGFFTENFLTHVRARIPFSISVQYVVLYTNTATIVANYLYRHLSNDNCLYKSSKERNI